MPHYNLPHNHGQNIEKVLNKMPSAEGFKDISFYFSSLAIRPGCGFYGCCAIVKNVYVISRWLWI